MKGFIKWGVVACSVFFTSCFSVRVLSLYNGDSSRKAIENEDYTIKVYKSKSPLSNRMLILKVFDKYDKLPIYGYDVKINDLIFSPEKDYTCSFKIIPKKKYDFTIDMMGLKQIYFKNLVIKDSTIINFYLEEAPYQSD